MSLGLGGVPNDGYGTSGVTSGAGTPEEFSKIVQIFRFVTAGVWFLSRKSGSSDDRGSGPAALGVEVEVLGRRIS